MAAARAHNIPPRVTIARLSDGTAALTRSFLRIHRQAGDVVLSAFKQAEDGSCVIVRLFNPGDVETQAVLALDAPVAGAFAVNFLEERQAPLPVQDGGIAVRLRPRRVQTIEIRWPLEPV